MANKGTWSDVAVPIGWFDETAKIGGWFSDEALNDVDQITGATTFTLSVASTLADLPSDGAISGTSALLFSVNGALLGSGALATNVVWTFASTATPTLFGQLSSSVPITITPVGTPTLFGQLSGTSALAFTPSSILTDGNSYFSGSLAFAFSPAGVLTGSAPLLSQIQMFFSADGLFTGAEIGEEGMVVGDGLVAGAHLAMGLHLNVWDRLQSNRVIP